VQRRTMILVLELSERRLEFNVGELVSPAFVGNNVGEGKAERGAALTRQCLLFI